MCARVYVHMCECVGHRSMTGTFFYCSPAYFPRCDCVSLSLELIDLTLGQLVNKPQESARLHQHSLQWVTDICSVSSSHTGAGDWNSGPLLVQQAR